MVGQMRERLTLQTLDPQTVTVLSITRSGTTATVTTQGEHGYATGDYVTIAGAVPTGFTGKYKITVTGVSTFTFTCSGALSSPASGAMSVVYVSGAQGERRIGWTTLDTVPAEMMAISAGERLQLQAVQSDVTFRFRIRVRTDLDEKDRTLWTPVWPPGAAQRTLEVTGILPFEDGLTYQLLECSESPRR